MDKIIVQNWTETFSRADHKIVYESDRYSEQVSIFGEDRIAEGKILQIATPNITLRQLTIQTDNELVLRDNDDIESVESLFVLNGSVSSVFPDSGSKLQFENKLHGFQYNPRLSSDHKIIPGRFDIIHLSYEMDFFRKMAGNSNESLLENIANHIEKRHPIQLASSSFAINTRMLHLIKEISNSQFQGITRYLYAESKMLELLALQLENIHQNSSAGRNNIINDSDRKKLKEIKEYIENNYLEPLTLGQLTRMFSLNEFKLKKGFRLLFSTTVFGLIHQLRMNHAYQLLKNRKMNVSEVAYFIGYQNAGSFSYEFKKKFGYSPRELV